MPHGALQEVLPDVFVVRGTMGMGPMRFSRNMAVIREGDRLVVVNSVRLNDQGLAQLDALGTVTDVIRIAGFHGSDDPFYKDRYGCAVHAIEGQTYFSGLDPRKGEIYFEPDHLLTAGSPLPLDGASLYVLSTRMSEGILRIPHGGGTIIVGDCLQNWAKADAQFNLLARIGMWGMGFLKPAQIGPEWAKAMKPAKAEMLGILDLDFDHLVPAHGDTVVGGAKPLFRPTIERYAART
jgi:hypothetical protein